MKIAVGYGMKSAGHGQFDRCLQNWIGEGIWAVGSKFGTRQLNWQLRAFGNIVERNPGDVMLDRVGVRDAGADANFNLYRFAGLECREKRYDWDVLFGFPVGGFDERGEHFVYFLACRRSGKGRTLKARLCC